MGRKRVEGSEPCPHCGGTSVRRNGTNRGRQRWSCRDCGRTFGATFGTPLYGLHTPLTEIVQALMILMRRGSLRAAEEITGHKYETIGAWLLRAHTHAEAISEVLVKELELDEVEADAFWAFVGNASRALQRGQVRHRGWAWPEKTVHAGGA
jgi:transposase-like protein